MCWLKANKKRNYRRRHNWDFSKERRLELRKIKEKIVEEIQEWQL